MPQVRAPDGLARTHRCATESADIPAQEGERVTVVSAAPADSGRGIGPFKSTSRTPGWRPSEPMAVTNHVTGRVSLLSRPPPKSGSGAAFDASFIISAALLLASGDAATGLIDPSLPRAIAIGAATAVAIGGATNAFVLPRLNQVHFLSFLRLHVFDESPFITCHKFRITDEMLRHCRNLISATAPTIVK